MMQCCRLQFFHLLQGFSLLLEKGICLPMDAFCFDSKLCVWGLSKDVLASRERSFRSRLTACIILLHLKLQPIRPGHDYSLHRRRPIIKNDTLHLQSSAEYDLILPGLPGSRAMSSRSGVSWAELVIPLGHVHPALR